MHAALIRSLLVLLATAGASSLAIEPALTGTRVSAAEIVGFTAAQAAAGEPLFNGSCAQCHGVSLDGAAGPALAGPSAKGLEVSAVFAIMTATMPLNNPATLPHGQYVAIMAYVLKRNGMKPGTTALTFDKAAKADASL